MNEDKPTINRAPHGSATARDGIPARSIPKSEVPEHGTGSGACSVCQLRSGALEVSETLNPDVSWTSQRVVILDAAGNGFAYDASVPVFQSLKSQGQATWSLLPDPSMALPPQKAWLETTLKDGTEVIDNVEIVS
jgi:hypothetical protein